MALYAGETVRVKSEITDFNGVAITPDDVTEATITIYDTAGDVVIDAAPLTYDTTYTYWYYDWDTVVGTEGAYRAKVRFVGAAYDTWEYITVRLRRNPVT